MWHDRCSNINTQANFFYSLGYFHHHHQHGLTRGLLLCNVLTTNIKIVFIAYPKTTTLVLNWHPLPSPPTPNHWPVLIEVSIVRTPQRPNACKHAEKKGLAQQEAYKLRMFLGSCFQVVAFCRWRVRLTWTCRVTWWPPSKSLYSHSGQVFLYLDNYCLCMLFVHSI